MDRFLRTPLLPLLLAACADVRTTPSAPKPVAAVAPVAEKPPETRRWKRLFDGETLEGWVTEGGRYDGNAAWTVEDGAITGRQNEKREGGLLYTEVPYTEFELELEVRLDEPFDSGIFLRMAPRGKGAQVTLDVREGGEVGAIYADGFLAHNEGGRALWKSGEWNRMTVRCTGEDMHVVATLNDAPLVDYATPAGTEGFAPTGLIGLQVHGERDDPATHKVQFRALRVRDLAPTPSKLFTLDAHGLQKVTPWGTANGWSALFDGKSLAGWSPVRGTSGFGVVEGVLQLTTAGDIDVLATDKDFEDFELRLEFKIAAMANSGVFLRAARDGTDPAYSGCEIQILDDFNWEKRTNSKLKRWQHTGSLYGVVPSDEPKVLRPLGEWNTYQVQCEGTRISTVLNGKELYTIDTEGLRPEQGPPFNRRAKKGFIGLQRHAGDVEGEAFAWFRNVFVREL